MTTEQLGEIRARYDATTPGVWTWFRSEGDDEYGSVECIVNDKGLEVPDWRVKNSDVYKADREFLAGAHQYVPALLEEIERLRAALEEIANLHLKYTFVKTKHYSGVRAGMARAIAEDTLADDGE